MNPVTQPVPRWKDYDFEHGNYPKTDTNDGNDRAFLRVIGFPEDFAPTEDEAYQLMTSFLEH